jgi:hypothetical protein
MKIKIKRSTVCDGVSVRPGDVIEADEYHAITLIRLGKAEPVDQADAPVAKGPMTTETAAPLVEPVAVVEADKTKRGRPRKG